MKQWHEYGTEYIESHQVQVSIGYDGCIDIVIPAPPGAVTDAERSIPPEDWEAIVAFIKQQQS